MRHTAIRRLGIGPRRVTTKRVESIDLFDRELLKFVLNWAPYGGPPDDEVLPRFGIQSDQLRRRVHEIVHAGLARNVHIDDRILLLRAWAISQRGS